MHIQALQLLYLFDDQIQPPFDVFPCSTQSISKLPSSQTDHVSVLATFAAIPPDTPFLHLPIQSLLSLHLSHIRRLHAFILPVIPILNLLRHYDISLHATKNTFLYAFYLLPFTLTVRYFASRQTTAGTSLQPSASDLPTPSHACGIYKFFLPNK